MKELKNIKIMKGNIFTTKCDVIVNAVNCVGVMGAGIAFEFRLRYPKMFDKYVEFCKLGKLDIGILWIYTLEEESDTYKKILNFPTKKDWKQLSKLEYLEKGLAKFVSTYKEKGIKSIAFPLLGSQKGGLSGMVVEKLLIDYLSKCDDLEVEIWHFDPRAEDDLYENFKKTFDDINFNEIKISENIVEKIKNGLNNENIKSFNGLLKLKGIGVKTLEKLFEYSRKNSKKKIENLKFKI